MFILLSIGIGRFGDSFKKKKKNTILGLSVEHTRNQSHERRGLDKSSLLTIKIKNNIFQLLIISDTDYVGIFKKKKKKKNILVDKMPSENGTSGGKKGAGGKNGKKGKKGKKGDDEDSKGNGGGDPNRKEQVPCSAYAYSLVAGTAPKCLEMTRWNGGRNCAVGLIHHQFEFELREWHSKYQQQHRHEITDSVLTKNTIKTIVLGDEKYEWVIANTTIHEGTSLQLVPCSMRADIEPRVLRDFGYLGAASHVSTAEGLNEIKETFGQFERFILMGYSSLTNTIRKQHSALYSDHVDYFSPKFEEHITTRHNTGRSKFSYEDLQKNSEQLEHEKDMFMLINFKVNRAIYLLQKLSPLLASGGVGILIDEYYVSMEIFSLLKKECVGVSCQKLDFDYLHYPVYYPGASIGNRKLTTIVCKSNPSHPNALQDSLLSLKCDEHFFSENFYIPNPKHPKPHILDFSTSPRGTFATGGICTDPRRSETDPLFDTTSINQETLALKRRLDQKRAKAMGVSYVPPPEAPPKKRIKPPVAKLTKYIDVDDDSVTSDTKPEPNTNGNVKAEPYSVK